MLLIRISNPGHRAVTIQGPSLRLRNGARVLFLDHQSDVRFPHELPEGKSCTVWTELPLLAQTLAKQGLSGTVVLVAECNDAVGTTYKSKRSRIDVSEWFNEE